MKYEFKSIVLSANKAKMLSQGHSDTLNGHFDEGWEYVDSICQSISTANDGFNFCGAVLVILRRAK